MQDIQDRADVSHLVRTFYSTVRKDATLGPIFERQISDWEEHFELLSDFWESNLLFVSKYKGNPHQVHVAVDQAQDQVIRQEHFGRWLEHWHQTIDSLFAGEKAEAAKRRARNMSTGMFIKIFEARAAQGTASDS